MHQYYGHLTHRQSRIVHTQERMLERYGYEMTAADYDEIGRTILSGAVRPFGKSERIYQIRLSTMNQFIYVAWCHETHEVKTVLTKAMAEKDAGLRKKKKKGGDWKVH